MMSETTRIAIVSDIHYASAAEQARGNDYEFRGLANPFLQLRPSWQFHVGNYVLLGVVSSLIALPVFEPDCLPEERVEWERAREEHFKEVRAAFAALKSEQRVLLFCHDPTALPFLWEDEA